MFEVDMDALKTAAAMIEKSKPVPYGIYMSEKMIAALFNQQIPIQTNPKISSFGGIRIFEGKFLPHNVMVIVDSKGKILEIITFGEGEVGAELNHKANKLLS